MGGGKPGGGGRQGEKSIGRIVSVNVGEIREVRFRGKTVRTAIWKSPVEGRLAVRGVNLAGDVQADGTGHGGFDKAIYAYAAEDYLWYEEELGIGVAPGTFGENLTTFGLDLNRALVGERWRAGTAVLEACQPRLPCLKLGLRMGEASFPRLFRLVARWGAYLRIIEEGELGAGDSIELVSRPAHEVSIGLIGEVYNGDHRRAGEILAAPELPASWRAWAERSQRR